MLDGDNDDDDDDDVSIHCVAELSQADTVGWTALHVAAAKNRAVSVSFLLDKGIDMEAQGSKVGGRQTRAASALIYH